MGVDPIKPDEVLDKNVPDGVMEAWNEIITENYSEGVSNFKQSVIMARILQKMRPAGITQADVFNKGWLNMEDKFRLAGWKVEYDKPGYNETYEANFTFSPRSKD